MAPKVPKVPKVPKADLTEAQRLVYEAMGEATPKVVPAERTVETVTDIVVDEKDSKPPPGGGGSAGGAGGGGKPPPAPVDQKDRSAEEQREAMRAERQRAMGEKKAPTGTPLERSGLDLEDLDSIAQMADEAGLTRTLSQRTARMLAEKRMTDRMKKENPDALARYLEGRKRAAARYRESSAFSPESMRGPGVSAGGFVRAPGIPAQLKVRPEEAEAGFGRAGSTVAKDSKAGRSILAARSQALGEKLSKLRDQRPTLTAEVRKGVGAYNDLVPSTGRISPSDSPDEIGRKLSELSDKIRSNELEAEGRTQELLQNEVVNAANQFQSMEQVSRQIQALKAARDQIDKELKAAEPQE